jgi:hypothetical protein
MTDAEQQQVDLLADEWKQFCECEYEEWRKKNKSGPIYLYNPHWMFEDEEERSKKWQAYIHEVGNRWWLVRGYKLIWPDSPKEPLKVEKI